MTEGEGGVGKILEFEEQRRRLAAKRAFQSWTRRFSEFYDGDTTLRDLSDATIMNLIRGGKDSSMPLYDFTMGVMGLGVGQRFHFLESSVKIAVMDIALFLLDQIRFEAMHRLGWVEDFHTFHVPMVDLVSSFTERYSQVRHHSPPLSGSHPRYTEYLQTFEADRGAFVRKLIPEAIQVFEKERGGPGDS